MFALNIDGNSQDYSVQGESTFGEVLEKLSEKVSGVGRVITSIKMNGQLLTEGRQYDFKNFPLSSIETIELDTTEPVKLAREALISSQEHIAQLKRSIGRTTELFRLGDELEANEQYTRLVEGLRWLVKGINAMIGMLGIDENEIILEGRSVSYYQDDLLVPVFDQMYKSQTREDWVELADLLEYELDPALDKWNSLIEAFQLRLAAA